MNPGPDEVCRWRQPRKLPGGSKRGMAPNPPPTPPMTTPAWITDRPPSYRDADPEQNVVVSTRIDNNPVYWVEMHWSRAAQGYLPWRHTSNWVPPEPEPPAPVIVTPEPEVAAPETGDWITHRLPTEADADKDGDVEFCILRRPNHKYCNYMNWETLIQFQPILPWRHTEWWTSPTPMAAEPTPAAPEPEPKKATRGFAQITTVLEDENIKLQIAIATDGTAWHRFVVRGDWEKWEQIQPLPQPGEE